MTTANTLFKRKGLGLGVALVAVFLILTLILAPTARDPQAANVQPALMALAAEQPDATVRVIVQTNDTGEKAESLIAKLGGTVIKELSIINAIVAEMGAKTAVNMGFDASVNWVCLDGPIASTQTGDTFTVRDEFNQDTK